MSELLIAKIMTQAQAFASSWALVGSRFASSDQLDRAEGEKKELRRMVCELIAERDALSVERDEADRRAGAADRNRASVQQELSGLKDMRRRMKRDWGVDDSVSFDVVWAEAMSMRAEVEHRSGHK